MSKAVNPESIAQLQRQLGEFRSTQPRGRRLPDSVWQSAVELAREHGVYSVAHPLRLDHMGLKKRLGGVSHRRRKARKPAFVELIAPPSAMLRECLIEFESLRGGKVRIQWKAAAPPDRGRKISQEDILYIRALIEQHPQESRRTLSTKLCEAWHWRQANGALRDMVCRGLLLMLDRAGQIELPPVSYVRHNPLANRARPELVRIDTTPIEGGRAAAVGVRAGATEKEPLWNSLLEEHHYLGYEQPVREHLKYLALGQGRPVSCLAGPRPRVIWAVATATSAGVLKRAVATSASSPTTRDF